MKFLFNLQTSTLKLVKERSLSTFNKVGKDHSLVLTEASQFRTLGGIGFNLDEWNGNEPPRSWIIFSVYKEKVRVVYKNLGTYYQRELTRPNSGIIEVEFSEWDRMRKNNKN